MEIGLLLQPSYHGWKALTHIYHSDASHEQRRGCGSVDLFVLPIAVLGTGGGMDYLRDRRGLCSRQSVDPSLDSIFNLKRIAPESSVPDSTQVGRQHNSLPTQDQSTPKSKTPPKPSKLDENVGTR
jgi:hypothetical protein